MSFLKYVLCTLLIIFVLQSISCYWKYKFWTFLAKIGFYCKMKLLKRSLSKMILMMIRWFFYFCLGPKSPTLNLEQWSFLYVVGHSVIQLIHSRCKKILTEWNAFIISSANTPFKRYFCESYMAFKQSV